MKSVVSGAGSGRLFSREDRPAWLRYSLTLLIVALATVGRAVFFHYGATGVHYITFYPAVFIAAFFLGQGPGFLAVALSVPASMYWIPPVGSFAVAAPAEMVALGVFAILSSVIVRVCEQERRADRRANEAEQAFEKERHTAKEFGGLGLGLAISKKLVELHGGWIAAFSEGKNYGASFRLVLPTATEPARERPKPALPGQAEPCAIRKRILLVEDNGDTVRILKKLLERQGHEVRAAGDVATALELAREEPFDLLVSDLGLPDRSGLDLMRELRAQGKLLPGIALSGYGQEQDIEQSRKAGFHVHLVKPVNLERLKAEVLRVAAGEELRR